MGMWLQRLAERTALICALSAGLALVSSSTDAQDTAKSGASGAKNGAKVPTGIRLGFSNLVFNIEGDDEIGIAKADFLIHILEALRARGFNAVGAEDLVFGKDHSDQAQMVLGGIVREVDCFGNWRTGNCRMGIEWQLHDVKLDRVVYKVMTRFNAMELTVDDVETLGKRLILGALSRLMDRPRFVEALRGGEPKADPPAYERASVRACGDAVHAMPERAEDVLGATLIVSVGNSFGSGFSISPDGYVLTAAHVVNTGAAKVRTRTGREINAHVVRFSDRHDVALLKLDSPADACLTPASAASGVGSEVYAAGAPSSRDLAFSLTRGIVSGSPQLDGETYLQTDASVSPGSSGGPLVNKEGRVDAVVSWKVVGDAAEGIAFGVPMQRALDALGITLGASTDAAMLTPVATDAIEVAVVEDTPDEKQSIDPEGDRDREISERTPTYVKIMKWTGVVLAVAGVTAISVSALQYDSRTSTQSEFQSARTINDLGWVGLGVGVGALVAALLLVPDVPEKAPPAGSQVSFNVGGDHVNMKVSF